MTFEPSLQTQDASAPDFIVRMEHITRRFPGVVANDDVHLYVKRATFHALIGENGAGKSTLLNILYGRIRPDQGHIYLQNCDVTQELRSPADAIRLGIGLVSQHHALIPALSVFENIVLGIEPTTAGFLTPSKAATRIKEIAAQIGLEHLDLNQRTEQLSLATLQKIEILKSLYRNAKILLLDEPTATLAPSEVESLFLLLHQLVQNGTTIVFVTHKLREVMEHSQYITVLRRGRNAGDFETSKVSQDELLERMLGAAYSDVQTRLLSGAESPPVPSIAHESTTSHQKPAFEIVALSVCNNQGNLGLRDFSLAAFPHEIIGVAGVDGSGQKELAEAIVGLRPVASGHIHLNSTDITRWSVAARRDNGIAYIPEDRHQEGLILDFTVAENLLLGHEMQRRIGTASACYTGGFFLNYDSLAEYASQIATRYDIRLGTSGVQTVVRTLSGGNQQKIVVARALESQPRLLIAYQPTRGLDIGATRFVHQALHNAALQGTIVLLFSLDLDEILLLAHRIVVLFNGTLAGIIPRSEASIDRIGQLMTGTEGSK